MEFRVAELWSTPKARTYSVVGIGLAAWLVSRVFFLSSEPGQIDAPLFAVFMGNLGRNVFLIGLLWIAWVNTRLNDQFPALRDLQTPTTRRTIVLLAGISGLLFFLGAVWEALDPSILGFDSEVSSSPIDYTDGDYVVLWVFLLTIIGLSGIAYVALIGERVRSVSLWRDYAKGGALGWYFWLQGWMAMFVAVFMWSWGLNPLSVLSGLIMGYWCLSVRALVNR